MRDDDRERGDGCGRTASEASGHERAAACMCTAENVGKTGEEASGTNQEKRGPPHPCQHKLPLTKRM